MTSATGAKGKKKALEAIAAKDKLLNSHLTPDCFEEQQRQSVFKASFGQLICRLPYAVTFQFFKDQMIFVTTNTIITREQNI